MSVKPINIGVVGVGHLGIHHVKHYTTIPNVNLLVFMTLMLKEVTM